MVADKIDCVVLAVNDIDNAVRAACLLEELHQGHARRRVTLTRLHDVRVAAHNS